jgi:hypothetical protein
MVDLDAPGGSSNNSISPLLHWLVALPTGLSELANNQSAVSAVAPYIGPAPTTGSGKHRYVVLLFSDPGPIVQLPSQFQEFDPVNISDRYVFNISGFAAEGAFRLVAANWFTTESLSAVEAGAAARVITADQASIMSVAAIIITLTLAY